MSKVDPNENIKITPKRDVYSELYNIIVGSGKDGISQKNVLGVSNLTVAQISKLAIKLEKNQFISREKSLENGRWTYTLKALNVLNLGPYEFNPCMRCPHEIKCISNGVVTPEECALEAYEQGLSNWVLSEYKAQVSVSTK